MATVVLSSVKAWAARSPMTDPKSLAASAVFHALLLVVASAAALGVALPEGPEPPPVLRGDVDPVDNVAKMTPGEGGGSPGAIGFEQLAAALEPVAPVEASKDQKSTAPAPVAPAEALLSEILPSRSAATDAVRQALPGPSTTLPGMAGASGSGGGGGSGGGAGGGVGRGVGPGTEFFGARENATSFVYVIDCSGSMAMRGSLDVAKRELMSSLSRLPPDARFGVIFYNITATVFTDPFGRRGMMDATAANKARVEVQLRQIEPFGGTEHMSAMRAAFELRPEVIFFLTDAETMVQSDLENMITLAGKTRVQAVEFGRGIDLGGPSGMLRRLATSTGGAYRYIDVTRFAR